MIAFKRNIAWTATFAILVAFAVPWPLWGIDLVVAGLPVWIWWHVGWLVLCSALFYAFVETGAWERGMGVESGGDASDPDGREPKAVEPDVGGDAR